MNNKLSQIALTLILAGNALSANATEYQYVSLSTLGGTLSQAAAINNSGQVVGTALTSGDTASHATVWNGVIPTDLTPGLPGWSSVANGVNNLGQITGNSTLQVGAWDWYWRASVWNGTNLTVLNSLPGAGHSRANSINNIGQVVGETIVDHGYHATLWAGNTAIELGTLGGKESFAVDINDAGQVLGSSQDSSGIYHTTLWSGGTIANIDELIGTSISATDINNFGQIVGQNTNNHAVFWNGSELIDLGTLGHEVSAASSINNMGQIVGSAYSPSSQTRSVVAFLWENGTMIDLNSFLDTDLVNAGWVLEYATDINDEGWIVGNASNNLLGISSQAFLLAPVPEPETYAMLLAGLGLVGFIARRRKVK